MNLCHGGVDLENVGEAGGGIWGRGRGLSDLQTDLWVPLLLHTR